MTITHLMGMQSITNDADLEQSLLTRNAEAQNAFELQHDSDFPILNLLVHNNDWVAYYFLKPDHAGYVSCAPLEHSDSVDLCNFLTTSEGDQVWIPRNRVVCSRLAGEVAKCFRSTRGMTHLIDWLEL